AGIEGAEQRAEQVLVGRLCRRIHAQADAGFLVEMIYGVGDHDYVEAARSGQIVLDRSADELYRELWTDGQPQLRELGGHTASRAMRLGLDAHRLRAAHGGVDRQQTGATADVEQPLAAQLDAVEQVAQVPAE